MKNEKFEALKNLCCRTLNPNETMSQIIIGNEIDFLKWNVAHEIGVMNNDDGEIVGLLLKLDHKNYDDSIFITLSFLDYYAIHFVDADLNLLHSIELVDCFSIFSVIDNELNSMTKFKFSLN